MILLIRGSVSGTEQTEMHSTQSELEYQVRTSMSKCLTLGSCTETTAPEQSERVTMGARFWVRGEAGCGNFTHFLCNFPVDRGCSNSQRTLFITKTITPFSFF